MDKILEEYKGRFGVCEFTDKTKLYNKKLLSELATAPKSIIVFIIPYYTEFKKGQNISMYAVNIDYHKTVKEELDDIAQKLSLKFKNNYFKAYCDNSPINEKKAARDAGLGFIGNNNLLINEKYGSYIFIGEILTDLELEKTTPNTKKCKNCGACKKECPASIENCLSAITQKKGELTEDEIKLIENAEFIWGCDICQKVCPHNKNLTPVKQKEDRAIYSLKYEDVESITNVQFRQKYSDYAFAYRGKKVILRNILIRDKKSSQKD